MAQSNVQQAREALGAHLRALRRDANLTGKELASRLGWLPSKVSKVELGQQTPSPADIEAWTDATGQPEARTALADELAALERFYQEYRQRLRSGMRFRQQEAYDTEAKARRIRVLETHYVPGPLQTVGYAWPLLAKGAQQHGAPDDVDEAVAVRMRRQDLLYRPGKAYHFVISEAALHSAAAAPREILAPQLDRLVTATALGSNIRFGVIPFEKQWPVFVNHGFWIIDDDFVIVETLTAELRLTRPDEVDGYARVFDQLAKIAVYGSAARAIITKVLIGWTSESDLPSTPD